MSYISDLVIARQELERVQYLNDIRERVEHLGAVHRYAEEYPEDPINRMGYGAPCRRRRSATWSAEQLNERAEDELIPVRSGAVLNEHGETTAMRIMDKLSELKVAKLARLGRIEILCRSSLDQSDFLALYLCRSAVFLGILCSKDTFCIY